MTRAVKQVIYLNVYLKTNELYNCLHLAFKFLNTSQQQLEINCLNITHGLSSNSGCSGSYSETICECNTPYLSRDPSSITRSIHCIVIQQVVQALHFSTDEGTHISLMAQGGGRGRKDEALSGKSAEVLITWTSKLTPIMSHRQQYTVPMTFQSKSLQAQVLLALGDR